MTRLYTLFGAAALACAASGALAQDRIVAKDPGLILAYFEGEGYPSTLETDGQGDPLIQVKYFGTSFSVYFWGCEDNTDCQSIQFYSGYRTEGSVDLEMINMWNTDFRYARGYLTEEGATRIEYDVYLGEDGVTRSDFDGIVETWSRGLRRFEEYIDW